MTDTKITIEFNQKTEHIQNFHIYHELNSKERKQNLLTVRVILFILLFIIFFLSVSNYDNYYSLIGMFKALFLSAFVSLLVLFSNNVSREKLIQKRTVKLLNKPENKNILENIKLEFDANGIHAKTDTMEVYYKWDCIVRTVSNDNYFFLYINSFSAIIIPKNVFSNDLDKQLFIKLLNKNNNGQKSNTRSDCQTGSERN